ncbi:aspartate kinase [Nonomuraea pusilla]|uniref:Aspartokinase n=1 Tax=Nonomuraea pusilla TaxID=46177 RepID=A0A1H7IDZ2_9ACTN|nr:aspartate kinase [Nonomuraea pusilla]SEK60062.1 aspartate kinase [Nonomuraea pusilla]
MDLVIQKYGGTSLGDTSRIRRAARRIAAADGPVVAVVSAMGRTTDSLLDLARDLTDSPHARELDLLLSTGEQASAAALALALHGLGVPARSFSARDCGIVTDGVHGRARIANVDPAPIRACVESGVVPVVTGFQGVAAGSGELTTLSRGGSDTTAVALAAALRAGACEIFTDVEGVFTADPRHVAEARKLDHLSYEDMAELAACGAAVLARSSVEYASAHGVPVHVRSSMAETAGTWVTGLDAAGLDGGRSTAISVVHRTGQLRCRLDGVTPAALTTIAATLADPMPPVDVLDPLVADPPGSLRFLVNGTDRDLIDGVLAGLRAAGAFAGCHWSGPMGTVSLVGRGFCPHQPEVRLLADTLRTHGVVVRDVTVDARRISVTCAEHDVLDAVTHLHRLFLGAPADGHPPGHRPAVPKPLRSHARTPNAAARGPAPAPEPHRVGPWCTARSG